MWIIYKHTCKINNKSYIGQTALTTKERWRNGLGYKRSKLFYNAIKKYGWENFSHEILQDAIKTREEANQLERYYIKKYHTWINDPKCNGYNLLPGGQIDNRLLVGKSVYQIDINKNIIAAYKSSAEAARELFPNRSAHAEQEIADCCKGKRSNSRGLYFCYQKDIDNYTIIFQSNSSNVILQLDKNKTILNKFNKLSFAAKALNINIAHIKECCDNKRHTAGGYYWCYEINYASYKISEPLTVLKRKPVIQINKFTLQEINKFPSAVIASKVLGISYVSINTCCRGKSKSAGGYIWKYEN